MLALRSLLGCISHLDLYFWEPLRYEAKISQATNSDKKPSVMENLHPMTKHPTKINSPIKTTNNYTRATHHSCLCILQLQLSQRLFHLVLSLFALLVLALRILAFWALRFMGLGSILSASGSRVQARFWARSTSGWIF